MFGFLEFVKAWAKLISEVFVKYPLAAAIVTLVAVAIVFLLRAEE